MSEYPVPGDGDPRDSVGQGVRSLRSREWALRYTSDDDEPLSETFFKPAMRLATKYRRGTGFFSSSLFCVLGEELGDFLEREGDFKILTSVKLSEGDYEALRMGHDGESIAGDRVREIIQAEFTPPISRGARILTRLLEIGRLELRIAVSLTGGIYHEKIGYFKDANDDVLAWGGSPNDGEYAYEANFEELKVFTGWEVVRCDYADLTVKDFWLRWAGAPRNLKVYDFPQAALRDLIQIRDESEELDRGRREQKGEEGVKWRHQAEAVDLFLADRDPTLTEPPMPAGRRGILSMATGTGKTRTACNIMARMSEDTTISRAVITTHLTDVLDQWSKEMDKWLPNFNQYKHYGQLQESGEYKWSDSQHAVLLCTRPAFQRWLVAARAEQLEKTLVVIDECHNYRGERHVEEAGGHYDRAPFKLGLSATPYSPYSDDANAALDAQIGPTFFTFGLEEAIRRRILCPFKYEPVEFELTDSERDRLASVRRYHEARIADGHGTKEEMYIALSSIWKTAEQKLDLFEALIVSDPGVLARSIIFVHSKEYGERLFERLIAQGAQHRDRWHHYYGEAEARYLESFRRGDLDCLVTCQKLNEGVDLPSVQTITLFASEQGRDGLTTTQRIGRALRFDPTNETKVATIIDFVRAEAAEGTNDHERRIWLRELAKVRPEGWEGS